MIQTVSYALPSSDLIVRIDVVPISELGPDLIQRWRDLQAGSAAFSSPFFTPDFALAVGRARSDLFVAIIETEGGITGLLPFHKRTGGRGVPVGGHLSDYHGIIGRAPAPGAASDLLRGMGLVAFDFNHALADQPLFESNAFAHSASPMADLRNGYASWKEQVSAKTKALKTLARKERKLARDIGPIRFESHDPSPAAWDLFVQWKRRALRDLGTSFLAEGWDAVLLSKLRQQQGPGFQGRLSTLYAGDRMVAAHFGLVTPQAWHWWFPAFDDSTGNLSVGLVLLHQCISAAAEQAISELDFGRGSERYKGEFSNHARALCEGSIEVGIHPSAVARKMRKAAMRHGTRWLPERHADLARRAGNRLLKAGKL